MTAKALSLTRPWPYCIMHLGKRVENRSRKDGREPKAITRYRGELWLHAAKSWAGDLAPWMLDYDLAHGLDAWMLSKPSVHPTGIVARCRAVGSVRAMADGSGRFEEYDFDFMHRPDELDMRWWMGGYGLVLADVQPLPQPIPCRGALGIWNVPEHIEREAREQLGIAPHAVVAPS